MAHLMQQKLPGKFKVKRLVGSMHQPGSDFIGAVKQNRHGYRVTHPYQANRQRQIHAEQNSKASCHNHLAGQRNKCHKKAHCERARSRTAVKAPQVGVIKHVAENLQRFLALDDFMTGQEAFNYMSWHCCFFYVKAWRQ